MKHAQMKIRNLVKFHSIGHYKDNKKGELELTMADWLKSL